MKTVKYVPGKRSSWKMREMVVGDALLVKDRFLFKSGRALASYFSLKLKRRYTARVSGQNLKITRTK